MIKQRKLKYKKNFHKRFHRNIHEFAVSRPQKKKKEKCKSFLLTSIRNIKGIAIGTVFSETQYFSRSVRRQMFLKNVKNLQNSQEFNAGDGVSFL